MQKSSKCFNVLFDRNPSIDILATDSTKAASSFVNIAEGAKLPIPFQGTVLNEPP